MKLDEREGKIPTFECHCQNKDVQQPLSSVHFWAKLTHRTLLGLQLQSPAHAQGKGGRKESQLLEYKLQNN